MRFSQKIGKSPIREIIQIESIDTRLENRVWNNILNDFFNEISNYSNHHNDSRRGETCGYIWREFFSNRIDEIPNNGNGRVSVSRVITYLKDWFFKSEWYEKYDLIEFLSEIDQIELGLGFTRKINDTLKYEMSGYRIVDNCIVQITSEEEIIEIEEALNNSSKWDPVNIHFKAALNYLSNRENPDYRNSIKEAISSIESLCVIITGDKDATLGKALGVIEKKYQIHGALKKAFSAFYGYTSDSGGIRHKLLEDDIIVSLEDAKFMLVSCSAFINYLKVKIEK